jgi:hypothetical protein
MKVAYVLYPDFTALDLVGPYGAGLYAVAGLLEGKASTTHCMATRMNSQSVAARFRRARRALSHRRANKRRPSGLVTHGLTPGGRAASKLTRRVP